MPSIRVLSSGSSSSRGRVPRSEVGPAAGSQLVALGQVDDVALAELELRRGREDLVDVGAVVVAGADDAAHSDAGETLVGPGDPLLDGAAHLRMEELVELVGVAGELGPLVGSHDHGVVAVIADRALVERQRVGAVEIVAHVLHVERVLAAAVVDDGDDRLAGHVAAEDEDVGLVVLAGVDELAPAGLRAVDVRGEEEPHGHVGLPCAALMCLSICRLAPFGTEGCPMRAARLWGPTGMCTGIHGVRAARQRRGRRDARGAVTAKSPTECSVRAGASARRASNDESGSSTAPPRDSRLGRIEQNQSSS